MTMTEKMTDKQFDGYPVYYTLATSFKEAVEKQRIMAENGRLIVNVEHNILRAMYIIEYIEK